MDDINTEFQDALQTARQWSGNYPYISLFMPQDELYTDAYGGIGGSNELRDRILKGNKAERSKSLFLPYSSKYKEALFNEFKALIPRDVRRIEREEQRVKVIDPPVDGISSIIITDAIYETVKVRDLKETSLIKTIDKIFEKIKTLERFLLSSETPPISCYPDHARSEANKIIALTNDLTIKGMKGDILRYFIERDTSWAIKTTEIFNEMSDISSNRLTDHEIRTLKENYSRLKSLADEVIQKELNDLNKAVTPTGNVTPKLNNVILKLHDALNGDVWDCGAHGTVLRVFDFSNTNKEDFTVRKIGAFHYVVHKLHAYLKISQGKEDWYTGFVKRYCGETIGRMKHNTKRPAGQIGKTIDDIFKEEKA